MRKILLLDNYDSFTYNLLHLVQSLFTGKIDVKRDYEINYDDLSQYCCIIISPGPGNPETTPMATQIISRTYNKLPILGICLGMQCINHFFGGKTVKAPYPIHGKTSKLTHNDSQLYKGISQNTNIARYHSLVIEPGKDIEITGQSEENITMSIKHKKLPIYGLQYHPESFLTDCGKEIIQNFLNLVGLNEQ